MTPTPGLPRVTFFVRAAGATSLQVYANIANEEFLFATVTFATSGHVSYTASAASWRAVLTNTSGGVLADVKLGFSAAQ